MPSTPVLIGVYLLAALLVTRFAVSRGRSPLTWFVFGVVITPPLSAVMLWFLPDLEHERRQTREFLKEAKQRRHRRDPHDTFSRTRERQEQEIQDKVITARRERQRASEAQTRPHRLRARENRTPATAIMEI